MSDDGERGSALMLMPAAVLVVLILGALAVDSAVMFLGERELADVAAAAANDAATVALRPAAVERLGALAIDQRRAGEAAGTVAAARSSDAVTLTDVTVRTDNSVLPPEVTVIATGTVRLVFTPTVPGGARLRTVQATAVAAPEAPDPLTAGEAAC